ncbi:MAG TPA: DsbA family protein [Devosiaceae bacterium]
MQRTLLALVALVAICSGLLATYALVRPAPALDKDAVRSIVSEVLADRASSASAAAAPEKLDASTINPMIESYLMQNPEILQKVSQALDEKIKAADAERARTQIAALHDQIFNDPNQIVVGNPNGDVTLVEMFDYNCTYCRSALPDLAALIQEDPNLRVVLKEFPILSKGSVDAARVAILVSQSKADYWTFHQALFSSRGQVNADTAWNEAEALGLDRAALEPKAASNEVASIIQSSYNIAKALNITGTPTFIIGNEIIPGAVGKDELKTRIANMRACGETVCGG